MRTWTEMYRDFWTIIPKADEIPPCPYCDGNVEDINILCTISGGFRIFLGDEKPQREQIMRAAKLTPELKCSNCGNVLAIIHEDFIHMHVRGLTVDREYVRKQNEH